MSHLAVIERGDGQGTETERPIFAPDRGSGFRLGALSRVKGLGRRNENLIKSLLMVRS